MCQCFQCKKEFQEIDLTWVKLAGKLVVLCKECYEKKFK